jgi:hypothetical protein
VRANEGSAVAANPLNEFVYRKTHPIMSRS